MAKTNLSDIHHDDLLKELARRLSDGATDAAAEVEDIKLPTVEEVDDLDTDALQEICEQLGISFDGAEDDEMKAHLKVFINIGNEETDDLDADEVKALAEALGIKPAKKTAAQVDQIKEYIVSKAEGDDAESDEKESEDEDEAADADEDAEAESEDEDADEDEDEKPAKKKKSKSDDEDEDADEEGEDEDEDAEEKESETEDAIDYEEVVAEKGKYPAKESVMLDQLTQYNEAADEPINVKKLGTKKAYAKLLALLVDHEGNIAKFGEPYIREAQAFCSGLVMEDVKFKGDKTEYVKDVISGRVYSLDEDNDFIEKED